jgi:hypothetical protein
VGEALADKGIPFVFTGGTDSMKDRRFQDVPRLFKPFKAQELVDTLSSLWRRGKAEPGR